MRKARCSFEDCNSAIIDVNVDDVILLPSSVLRDAKLMQLSKKPSETQQTNEFLLVNDVWDFDNIGVSKEVPEGFTNEENMREVQFEHGGSFWRMDKCLKYLICSDCDKGPIGFGCSLSNQAQRGAQNKVVYLLSLESVKYV
ncbi:hypothetical protein HG535_0B03460 [Zygotorulaspora mrakii]|uniref:Uncharacterized protein n=1 Tax=Zygotorulaspora mrakii TaxID=42260 RepID=A0A7H9AYR9_ZYGMR|nr:uncharacterized protein HG535_0B03460 [Zygotorulaspora mrakii]QLG71307.1 hypothetical protein HG535_0B03460 [Zygotorulaspora mrakii]